MHKLTALSIIAAAAQLAHGQSPSPFIHVDQFGYLPGAEKVAVLSDPRVGYNQDDAFTPSGTVELRNAGTHAVVFAAPPVPWNQGAVHDLSGDAGWWFDFSSVSAPGTYYVIDPPSGERTGDFDIRCDVYADVLVAAQRMFYYNRCNAPKNAQHAGSSWADGMNFANPGQDTTCRYVYDPQNVALQKNLAGGWFDAGDYNKYVTFAHSAVHDLLSAFEENPHAFGDANNVPASGNGVPDLLDEVKWELDWLFRMSNADGSVHIKMGSIDYGDNAAAPPSANFDARFYGPTCSSASVALASMFAHASLVLRDVPQHAAYAQSLKARAISAWRHVAAALATEQLDVDCDDGTIKSGDADWSVGEQLENALVAAVYLFALTGDAEYHDYLADNHLDAEPLATGFWGAYKMSLNTALLFYASLPSADPTLAATIRDSISTAASNNWNGYYGFNDADLYRTFMPDWSYHWGSNSPKAAYGILNRLLVRFGIQGPSHADFTKQALEHLHSFHGVNPLGMAMLSNMYAYGAERCANQIYHTWFQDGSDWDHAQTSLFGPAPGFVPGGPNKDFTVQWLIPPAGQPALKSYLDFNDNFPLNSWEITEPAIYYQALYVRLLANFARPLDCPLSAAR